MQAPLLLSCKITHSCLRFLERRGEDLEPLYERFDWPLHYLRDASSWLEADRLEFVLRNLEELYGARAPSGTGEGFFEVVGHAAPELRAWGALDSVLRIVPGLRELYQQPDRFLASFISPAPQLGRLLRLDEKIEFRFDFSDDRMPCTARYLRAVLEALPEFIGKPHANVQWANGNVSVEWSERQVALTRRGGDAKANGGPVVGNGFIDRDETSLSPELLRTILMDLAGAQRDLEQTRRQLKDSQEREVKLTEALARLESKPTQDSPENDRRIEIALYEIHRLGDYFARAQQLVTLLKQSVRSTAGTQTADTLLKRTSWERVSGEAPLAIARARDVLNSVVSGEPSIERFTLPLDRSSARTLDSSFDLERSSPSRSLSFFDQPNAVSSPSSPVKPSAKGAKNVRNQRDLRT